MIRAWTFVAAFFVLFIFATGGDPRIRYFPWGEKSFQEHQDDILDGFREDMFLDFKEDTLPKEFLSFEMHVKNLEGLIFSMEKDRKGLTKVKSSWSPIIDVHVINALLDGVCGMFHVQYWVYEWCHMNEIRQFHMEIVNGAVGRNPDWSLGSFQRSIVVRERGDFANFSAAIVKVVDYYDGGQPCDENRQKRKTEVHIQCCESAPWTSDPMMAQMAPQFGIDPHKNPTPPVATIQSVSEPDTCAYKMNVCLPAMCPPAELEDVGKPVDLTDAHGKALESTPLRNVISGLSECMVRQEEWWTYELCFGKHVRQFHLHVESMRQQNGMLIQNQVLQGEFLLGKAPLNLLKNETHLRIAAGLPALPDPNSPDTSDRHSSAAIIIPTLARSGMPTSVVNKQHHPKSMRLEFVGGTACDIENVTRSTTVEIFCGPKDMIVDIMEDSTCHYYCKVYSTQLCTVPGFEPKQQKTVRVDFFPHEAREPQTEPARPLE